MTMPASAAALPAATPAKVPSAAYAKWLARQRREKTLVLASRLLLLAAFFGLWEILAKTKVVNPMLTSYPSALWPTFVDLLHNGNLLTHTWATFKATVVGFVLSMVFGIAIAAGLWWSRFANKVLDPFLVVANAMPKIAFVPIFYIWLGSEYSVYGMAVAIAIFVTIMVAYEGFQSTDPNKIKLATTLGASRAQVLEGFAESSELRAKSTSGFRTFMEQQSYGHDYIEGGPGNDVLIGGAGADTFNFNYFDPIFAGTGVPLSDHVYGFESIDTLRLGGYGFQSANDVFAAMQQQGGDVVLTLSPSNTVTIHNTTLSQVSQAGILLASF